LRMYQRLASGNHYLTESCGDSLACQKRESRQLHLLSPDPSP
jgi:hypothetical protein